MNPDPHSPGSRYLFTIAAESDPQLPCRILGLFTLRGYLPEWFSVRKTGNAVVRLVVEIAGLDDHLCTLLARKMLNIPTVLEVSHGRLRQGAEVVP